MVNIVIIGNGFDMAHGLQTSYNNFLKNLIDKKFIDKSLYTKLFNINQNISKNITCYDDIRKIGDLKIVRNILTTNNKLFKSLTNDFFDLNWCDIEKLYFKELSNIGQPNCYKSASKLNSDFEIIKNYLEEYLVQEQLNFQPVWVYEQFFERLDLETTLVLNFNYTNTIQAYTIGYNIDLVQIHGTLKNESNPIIFGFAADDRESRNLIKYDDKEFMRNIKKHNYKRTNEEDRLVEFLNNNKDIEVSIIGHSCGISDKLILNQIFNHKNVTAIRLYYYQNYEHYFETQVNIDRIMNNDLNFRKLINFQDSLFIPQNGHDDMLETFSDKSVEMFKLRKENFENRYRII